MSNGVNLMSVSVVLVATNLEMKLSAVTHENIPPELRAHTSCPAQPPSFLDKK